jgi:hypothetical protein
MSDMPSVDKAKAAMMEKNSTYLNSGPAQIPCGAKLKSTGTKRPTGHVEIGTGRKS